VLSRDGVAGLICLGVSLVLLWVSRGLPQPALVPIGPGFYPGLLFGLTAALSAGLVVTDVLGRGRRVAAPPPVAYRLVVLAFGVFAGYVFLLPMLGYRVATLLFVAILQAVLDPPRSTRAWALAGVMGVATSLLTYYVFEHYLHVLLPRGRWTGF
jgi:putative tricarboxylic transport membrane protein